MKAIYTIPIAVIVCFAVGLTASLLQQESLMQWYPLLNKSSLTPPNIVFPIVWSVLYLLMGISVGIVAATPHPQRPLVIAIFAVQLIINFLWCILFFTLRNPLLGLIDIVLLDVLVVLYIVRCFPINRAAALLFLPYIVWLMMASYLNGFILMNN